MPKVRLLPSSISSRRRWTEDDARSVLTAQEASGLSVVAFAAREGLDAQRVYAWRRRLGGVVEATSTPAFIELRPPGRREIVEVGLRCGRVVRVAETIDPSALRRLVDALEQEPTC